jgi:hypothetical protein
LPFGDQAGHPVRRQQQLDFAIARRRRGRDEQSLQRFASHRPPAVVGILTEQRAQRRKRRAKILHEPLVEPRPDGRPMLFFEICDLRVLGARGHQLAATRQQLHGVGLAMLLSTVQISLALRIAEMLNIVPEPGGPFAHGIA